MPAVTLPQAKRVEEALACCHPTAGPIEKFDTAVGALEPEGRDLAVREAGRQLRQLHMRLAHFGELASMIETLQTATAYRAIVLGADTGNGELPATPRVHLALLGQQLRVVAGALPGMDAGRLRPGDEVEVVQTGPQHWGVRRCVGQHVRHGVVGRMVEVLGHDLLRVSRGPDTMVLRAVGALRETLRRVNGDHRDLLGRLVSFDEPLGMAFNFLSEEGERERYVLREVPSVRRADLVLSRRTLDVLESHVLLPLLHAEEARRHRIAPVRFVIFTGPPGVGKTHAARWLATELGRPVYLTSGADVASKWYGETEARLKARIRAAQEEPGGAVVIWDEAESLLGERGRSMVGVEDRVVSLLLSETDGFERRGDVVFVLTTNRADRMDQALRRSLRAVTIPFERPDPSRTRALFQLYLAGATCLDAEPEALARAAALAIFSGRTRLGDAVLRDGSRLPLTPAMAVSGALVRASCESADRRSFVRRMRANGTAGPAGILRDDLLAAVGEELASMGQSLTATNVAHALTLPPGVGDQIVALEPPTGNARPR